jgi:hypothetical protein
MFDRKATDLERELMGFDSIGGLARLQWWWSRWSFNRQEDLLVWLEDHGYCKLADWLSGTSEDD